MTHGQTIAIASGKGGVGKTWFAITLAHALARLGRRAMLFDADLGLANVDIQLGLTPRLDLATVISGKATVADATLHCADGGFDIIAGRSGSGLLSAIDAATVLVLSGGLDPAEAADVAHVHAAAGARLLVATKLDLARRLGGILAAAGAELALTEAGIGPGVADGLLPITPAWLAARMLSGVS